MTPENVITAPPDTSRLRALQIRNAFEKLLFTYGPQHIHRFQYNCYPHTTIGLVSLRDKSNKNLRVPLYTLNQKEARGLVLAQKFEPPKVWSRPYTSYQNKKTLALRKTVKGNVTDYSWETHLSKNQSGLLKNTEFKLLWPENQKASLIVFLRESLNLGIRHVSLTLNASSLPYLCFVEIKSSKGLCSKSLISRGATKKEANAHAKFLISQISGKQASAHTKMLTCLSIADCKKILSLLQNR